MLHRLGLFLAALAIAPAAAAQAREEPFRRHHVSVVLGGTTAPRENETGFTFGVDYEYRLRERFGLGGVVERAGGRLNATSLIALVDVHLSRQLVVQAGPGVTFEEGERFVVGRIGGYYEFELRKYTLSPTVSYDFAGGGRPDEVVFGVQLGRQF